MCLLLILIYYANFVLGLADQNELTNLQASTIIVVIYEFWMLPFPGPHVNQHFTGTAVHIQTTGCCISQNGNIHNCCCENVRSCL
jgi:hypothetical protein